MTTLDDKKAKRFIYLNALYEKTDGDTLVHIDMWELAKEINFPTELTHKVVEYLKDEGLLEYVAMGGIIAITHYGVIKMEEAISSPDEETQYFPPAVNIMNVHTMIGSQIQQGSTGGSQSIITSIDDITNMREFVKDVLNELKKMELKKEESNDIEAEINTINSQLSASKPKKVIVQESLKTIRTILEGAAGNVIASELIRRWLPFIIGFLGAA